MSIYEASSRPTSYISHAGNPGSEDGDPWAVHEEASQSNYSLPQETEGRQSEDSEEDDDTQSIETDQDEFNSHSTERQDDTVRIRPAQRQPPNSIHQDTERQSSRDSQSSSRRHTAVASSSSSGDPWGRRSPQSTGTHPPSSIPQRFSNIPTSSSAIRGGFNLNDSSENDRPSSPYEIAKSDVLAQKSTLAHLKNQPGPWDDEEVYVTLRPELEGLIFKYNSYNIIRKKAQPLQPKLAGPGTGSTLAHARSAQRSNNHRGVNGDAGSSSRGDDNYALANSKSVVRRYSDFVWMNEILVKRYPFRIVPILPPKRLSIPVAGRHLSSDDGFMERRRRGLQRYLCALIVHPVLCRDELVQVFLTEKQPLSEWKQSHTPPSTEEEAFTSPPQPSALLSIPSDLSTKLEQTTTHTNTMVEKWTNFVNLFERISKRQEAQGLDFSRLASQLDSLTSINQSCFKPESDPDDYSTSLRETSTRLSSLSRDYSDLNTVRAKGSSESTLELLKSQRDLWMAFRDLIARHTALSTDNVSTLKQRISTSRGKVANLKNTPVETRSPSYHKDVDTLEASIQADSLQVESLLKRREFIRLYMWQELNWLWKCKTQPVELAWKSWTRDELVSRSAEKRAVEECWKDLGGL